MSRIALFSLLLVVPRAFAQELPVVRGVEGQPLMAQVMRLKEALAFLGSSLEAEDEARLEALTDRAPDESVVAEIQEILDPYCLAMVEINPEARVKVIRGPAVADLIEGGWRSFLVKVQNDADVNAELVVESPNAMPILHRSSNEHRALLKNTLSPGQVANRFLELAMYHNRPLQKSLSGLKLEYAVMQAYSREAGRREAKIGFHVGQGTQDIGFRNTVNVLFDVAPAVAVMFNVTDERGRPTMASFIITDGVERLVEDSSVDPLPDDYRMAMARKQPWDTNRDFVNMPAPASVKRLVGISGETDYPCIFDNRIGMARSYAKLDGALDFDKYMDELKNGRSYVSDGKSHIIDFHVDERELGTEGSELRLDAPKTVTVTARVAAYLPEEQDELGAFLASRALDEPPYWDIDRARIGTTRNVLVELVVNGEPVASQEIVADGSWTDVSFKHGVDDSSWVAVRILASSHTNPIFVLVDDAPIRASVESAEWCRKSVDQCWDMKLSKIREADRAAARDAYDHARRTYDWIIEESRARR